MTQNRTLISGDSLTDMQKLPDTCIDLITTDPVQLKMRLFRPIPRRTRTWTQPLRQRVHRHMDMGIRSRRRIQYATCWYWRASRRHYPRNAPAPHIKTDRTLQTHYYCFIKQRWPYFDPFCGTTLIAAESPERHWFGIDLTYLAIGAVQLQFENLFPNIIVYLDCREL